MTKTIKCVFMDKAYDIRNGDVITTDEAYWMEDELIINSFHIGDDYGVVHTAYRIVEMKLDREQNLRISTPISGKVVGRIIVDNFRNVTMFTIEV